MFKLLGSLALTGLLVGGLVASSSAQQSYEVTEPSATPPGGTLPADNFDTFPGVLTNGGTAPFAAFLNQLAPVQHFAGNSSVSFGFTQQTPGGIGMGSYTNVPANFTFDLTVPDLTGATKQFQVQGLVNGTVSFDGAIGATDASFVPETILVDGVATPFVSATSPAGRLSDEISNLDFGTGTNVTVFFDQVDALTAPGPNTPLSIGGYVESTPIITTPEPGAMALLTGMGLSGLLFVRTRRRRA